MSIYFSVAFQSFPRAWADNFFKTADLIKQELW